METGSDPRESARDLTVEGYENGPYPDDPGDPLACRQELHGHLRAEADGIEPHTDMTPVLLKPETGFAWTRAARTR